MTQHIDISLTPQLRSTLASAGVKLAGLAKTNRLLSGSRIETPTSILSTVTPGAFLEVGAFCNLSGGTLNNVRVGRYCSIASGVVIGSHEHPTNWLTTSRAAYYPQVNGWDELMAGPNLPFVRTNKRPFPQSCPVTTLGPDVWIGQGAFIKSGVRIGAGAIIGARATVLKDVPPYAIVVGTPGKVLRLRFPDLIVERLLSIKWWNYNIYDLFEAPFDDVERALGVLEEKIGNGKVAPYSGRMISAEDLADPHGLAARFTEQPLRDAG
ncbi:CatB-related O-acetyltransferase [Amaricoccus macauensis]|uniref:CatB-related O-acetyltransferase n=1 Tax=Amaricoccus macauensis TaxID=57001 RepID=UPI003C7CFB55